VRLYRTQDQKSTAERENEIGLLLLRQGPMDAETVAQTTGLGLDRVRLLLAVLERQGRVRVSIESIAEVDARVAALPRRAFVRVQRKRRMRYAWVVPSAAVAA
jgi:sugar-specific transcriptional regulator TrmB